MAATSADMVARRRVIIEENLSRDRDNVTFLSDSLQRSRHITKTMEKVIDDFGNRLAALEEMIKPIHSETTTLTQLQDSLSSTVHNINDILAYFAVADELGPLISKGPNDSLEKYLADLECISNAMLFFSRQKLPGTDAPMTQLKCVYAEGISQLEAEFQSILKKDSLADKVLPPSVSSSPQGNLSASALSQLSSISSWLTSAGKVTNYAQSFSSIRSSLLESLLRRSLVPFPSKSSLLRPPIRSTDNNSAVSTSSSLPSDLIRRPSLIATRTTQKPKQEQLPLIPSLDHSPISAPDLIDLIDVFVRMIQSEQELVVRLFPSSHVTPTLTDTLTGPLALFHSRTQSILDRWKKSLPENIDCFFELIDIYEAYRSNDLTLINSLSSAKVPFDTEMAQLALKTLTQYDELIRSDSTQKSKLAPDGTVHSLARNTMTFFQRLANCSRSTISALLTQQQITHHKTTKQQQSVSLVSTQSSSSSSSHDQTVRDYLSNLLNTLVKNLEDKAKSYDLEPLRLIFLANNFHYILKTAKKSQFLELLEPNFIDTFEQKLSQTLQNYAESTWKKALRHIRESEVSSSGKSAKTDNKQAIKDRFKGFNGELEDAKKAQRVFAIPDRELLARVRTLNRTTLNDSYCAFLARYQNVPFTKNLNKYLKYSPDIVMEMLDGFFDERA